MQGILMSSKQLGNLRKHFVITPHETHLAKKSICLNCLYKLFMSWVVFQVGQWATTTIF